MRRWVLLLVIIVAFLVRVVSLNEFPDGFTPDEASFGYDAYSILKTGKDQWGHSFPLVLESFGDYKPPLYSYVLIPFVALFDLSRPVVRLPNALLGTAAVVVVYLLFKEMFERSAVKRTRKEIEIYSIFSAFLLGISSWHIMLSRGAFEANMTTFLLPFGILLFLKGLKKPSLLKWSFLIFGLNLFSYHSAKLVTPIVISSLIFLYRKEIVKMGWSKLTAPLFIFATFVILTGFTFAQGAGERVQEVSVLKSALSAASDERTRSILAGTPTNIAKIIHNKYQVAGRQFVSNYFRYFSPRYLFSDGPAEATYGMIPGRGVLYWFELPLLLGLLSYLSRRKLSKGLLLLMVWLLVAPIPAALSTGPGSAANRAAAMMPALQMLLVFGAVEIIDRIKACKYKKYLGPIVILYSIFLVIFFASFVEDYFVRSPAKVGKSMLYGNLETARWLTENAQGKKVIVSRGLSEPQIYFAFAAKLDPTSYQEQSINWDYKGIDRDWVDQIPTYSLDNYTFRDVHIIEFSGDKETFVVARPESFPEKIETVFRVEYANNTPAVFVVDPEHYEE